MELIEQILRKRNLSEASKEVIRNKGAAGIDGMQTRELKSWLDKNRQELEQQVRNREYLAPAVRGKEIPKRNKKKRLLGIPTVIDRMLQQAVMRVLTPHYEGIFAASSYGFRPHRNAHQAIGKAVEYIGEGNQYIVDIDLKSFFDEVEHRLLLEILYRHIKCSATLCLLRRWLRAPVFIEGKLRKRRKGLPQGSPLSPLLSNIILHELDKEMTSRGLKFVRYADDFSIYCKTKTQARRTGNQLYLYLRDKLRLPVNREKSGIRRPVQFSILGYNFVSVYEKGAKGKYQLVVEQGRWTTLKQKLREATRKTSPMSFDERMEKIKQIQRGWINYFRHANMQEKLKDIDGWVRNRIRYCIWTDWKKRERKRKNLIRLGVDPAHAYQWSRTRKGGWAVAQSPILVTTITLSRLVRRGYESMLMYYQSVNPSKLTPELNFG